MNSDRPIRVLFVCLGNICRSPLAEGICLMHLEKQGLLEAFEVDSAGTSGWHAGEAPDPGSIKVARRHGVDISAQRSRPLESRDAEHFDFLVAMDQSNARKMEALGTIELERLVLARTFDPESRGGDVPDPYGGGTDGFQEVWDILDRAMPHMIRHMQHYGPR